MADLKTLQAIERRLDLLESALAAGDVLSALDIRNETRALAARYLSVRERQCLGFLSAQSST